MLRRLKDILHLPRRTNMVIPMKFDGQDEGKYNEAKRAAIQYLDDIIISDAGGNGYLNAISKINALRMVCNLGCFTDRTITLPGAASSESSSEGPLEAGKLDVALGSKDEPLYRDDLTEATSTCTICGILIMNSPPPGPMTSIGPADLTIGKESNQCRSCVSDSIGTLGSAGDRASMLQLESQLSFNNRHEGEQKPSRVFSTKVNALVKDLTIQRQAKKRSV